MPNCRSGHDGHSLSQCHSWDKQHRVQHACGNRHGPQCQQHTTQQWLQHHLDQQRPGPHVLLTCTVPETLRPFLRSQQRPAYAALCNASSHARTRLATDERCIGTDLPGCTGSLPTWGRPLQYHPHLPSIVPGGGLAKDRAAWRPARASFFVPVKALSPISRAIVTQERPHAGRLTYLAPQVWAMPWNVHSQANPNGQTSFTDLAPSVCKVAIANRRLVSRTDRTVTFTSRTPGRARPRPTHLDAIACLRRFLHHVLPAGCMQVRHFGCMHARWAIPTDSMRLMSLKRHDSACTPPDTEAPAPLVASCPACGTPMQRVMRLWTSNRAFLDTG